MRLGPLCEWREGVCMFVSLELRPKMRGVWVPDYVFVCHTSEGVTWCVRRCDMSEGVM